MTEIRCTMRKIIWICWFCIGILLIVISYIRPNELRKEFSAKENNKSKIQGEGMMLPETINYDYEIQELCTERDGHRIYGVIYIPRSIQKKMPTVIFSHGYGGSYQGAGGYAQALAEKGYVSYRFDFCGGSSYSHSDGSAMEMSLFTEQADLEAVIRMIQGFAYVDTEKLFLIGTSQGGAVSAITGAAHADEIHGMVLIYPAFVMVDDAKELFGNVNHIPDTYNFMGMDVGRTYFETLLDYDIYGAIAAYDKDVLVIHGDADQTVPVAYSEQALEYILLQN